MGLLKIAKKGADELVELADNLLNAKKADEIVIPERPEGLPKFKRDMTPEQVKEYDAWKSEYQKAHYKLQHQKKGEAKNAKKRAETQARKDAEKAARIKSGQLLPQDMSPDQLREYNAEMMRRHRAKRSEEKVLADREKNRVSAAKRRDAINADPERRAEYLANKSEDSKAWRVNNPEAAKEKSRRQYEKDPAKAHERWVRRSHAQQERTPEWRDQEKINEIYRARSLIQEITGIPHHVDHIIPLRGSEVSGLHHQDNLMIVPGTENLSKGRTFTPGTPPPKTGGVRQARRLLKQLQKAKEGQ